MKLVTLHGYFVYLGIAYFNCAMNKGSSPNFASNIKRV